MDSNMHKISRIRRRVWQVTLFTFLAAASVLLPGLGSSEVPRLETVILGSNILLADSASSLRVSCRDHLANEELKNAQVNIRLKDQKGKEYALFAGRTGNDGIASADFTTPSVPAGNYTMLVRVDAIGETDQLESPVIVQQPVSILITTDKPIYQPGQMIHIRALSLWTGNKRPAANTDTTLEIEDAKGNKVFKKIGKTSPFGIVSADFQLADEISMGQYKIRTTVGNTDEEKTVTVDRYVLPKFKIAVKTDHEYYTPGQAMSGNINTDYIFGKPVVGGTVEVKLSTYDVTFSEFATVSGKTDGEGHFHFDQTLPAHFVGQPLDQGAGMVKIDVKVTDTADHEQTMSKTVPVAGSALLLNLIPERKTMLPGMDMGFYAIASTPDGQPVPGARLRLAGPDGRFAQQEWITDDSGLVEIRVPRGVFVGGPGSNQSVSVVGHDQAGNEGKATVNVLMDAMPDGILLRTATSLVRAGRPLYCEARLTTPDPTGTIYFDVIKDGRTVLTRTARADSRGVAGITFSPTEDLAGTLRIHAYRLSYAGQIVRDSRVVFVSPSTDLAVTITTDKQTYRPGENAKLVLQVGRRGASAIGLSIVDESVFALQEMHPGMERVYFLLEQELLHPRYEIHSITPERMFEPAKYTGGTQLAAKALFAQAEPVGVPGIMQNSYAKKIEPFLQEWKNRLQSKTEAYRSATEQFVARYSVKTGKTFAEQHRVPMTESDWRLCVQRGWISQADLKDQWGHVYRFAGIPRYVWNGSGQVADGYTGVTIQSAGIDGRFDTIDDIAAYVYTPGGYTAVYASIEVDRDFGIRTMFKDGGRAGGFGGGGGEFAGEERLGMVANAAKPAAEGMLLRETAGKTNFNGSVDEKKQGGAQEPRMRQYFPETLYWNPAIITDETGKATIEVPMADSITTWRATLSAVNRNGEMGSATAPIKVFQDFFVDIDLPVALTQNDEVSIPVAVYNYLPGKQTVALEIESSGGMEFLSDRTQSVTMGANDVRAVYFRFKVTGLGRHKLIVRAKGDRLSDAMTREIDVLPDGRRETIGFSDRLGGVVEKTVDFPNNAINDASNVIVKIYPGLMATVLEGMDKIFQMPGGCFEQTSSSTYPNVMVLDYMKQTKQITPEIQMKAEQYINLGYQRLLSFEVKGGGFEWFGNAPANKVLTAYGLLEFSDMAKVYNIDPALLARTQSWLESKQNGNGSWNPDQGGIAEGAINRQNDVFKTTAYIAWAMAESGSRSPSLMKALAWLNGNLKGVNDAYALALTANAQLAAGQKTNAIEMLLATMKRDREKIYFNSETETLVYSRGKSGDVETTALALLALMKAGGHTDVINKGIGFLISSKDPSGTWYSTQATVFALKALITAMKTAGKEMNGEGRVLVNNKVVGTFVITPEDYDVVRQFDAKQYVEGGANEVRIEYAGKGTPMYQITGIYYAPWSAKATDQKKEMDIDVNFDKHELAKDDIVTSNVRVIYNGPGVAANMVIVDLGTPPGFDVIAGDLAELVSSKKIQKFSLTGRQAILYFDKLEKGKSVTFSYRMKAKYPLRARTPASKVYEYYNPENVTYSPPQSLVVSK